MTKTFLNLAGIEILFFFVCVPPGVESTEGSLCVFLSEGKKGGSIRVRHPESAYLPQKNSQPKYVVKPR